MKRPAYDYVLTLRSGRGVEGDSYHPSRANAEQHGQLELAEAASREGEEGSVWFEVVYHGERRRPPAHWDLMSAAEGSAWCGREFVCGLRLAPPGLRVFIDTAGIVGSNVGSDAEVAAAYPDVIGWLRDERDALRLAKTWEADAALERDEAEDLGHTN